MAGNVSEHHNNLVIPKMAGNVSEPHRPNNLVIPKGTSRLKHQVAGHVFGRKNRIGFLQSEDGFVLKPLQGSGRGERELELYREVFQSDPYDEITLTLQNFIPRFFGTWITQEYAGEIFIKLEDVTAKFTSPCIMDVKIGDFYANAKKFARWKVRCPALDDVRFQVDGVKTSNLGFGRNSVVTLDRFHLRLLDKDAVLTKGIAAFFPTGEFFHPALVHAFIRRLENIESWFMKQTSWQFFGSSLLLIYDADAVFPPLDVSSGQQNSPVSCSTNGEANGEEKWFDSHVDVRMIDFAHVFPLPENQPVDTNFLSGLRSLIAYLKRVTASTYDSTESQLE